MAAISDPGAAPVDPNALRLAAIARAAREAAGTSSLAGTVTDPSAGGLVPPTNGYQGSGGIVSPPMGPPLPPGATIGSDITSGLNPLQPSGTPTMAAIPGQNAPIPIFGRGQAAPAKGYSDPNGLATGPTSVPIGSLGSAPSVPNGSVAPAITQVPAQQGTSAPASTPTATPGISTPTATPTTPTAPVPTGVENQSQGAPADTGSGGLQQLTGSIVSQIQNLQQGLSSPGTPADATAVFFKQSQAILGMLNDQEAQLRADAQKQGSTIDPSTQFTLDKLRQTLEDNMKSTRETLNSRGLYESGILLELENKLQKGTASDEAMILGQRLSKLQDELNAGLTNIRNQRFQTSSQFGLAAGNAQTSADENAKKMAYDREQAALQAMLNLRGQQSSEAQAAAARSAAAAQQQATFNQQNQSAAAQRAFDAQQAALSRSSSAASAGQITPYQQAQLDLQRQAQQFTQSQAASANAGKFSATNTDQALNSVLNNFTYAPDALAAIQANAGTLQQQGVDINTLMTEVAKRLPSNQGSAGSSGMK